MRIFEGRYFHVNKRILMLAGLWPYETKTKTIIRTIFRNVLILLAMPHLISVIVHFDDVDRVMLNVISFFSVVQGILKMSGLSTSENRMKKLYESIEKNWQMVQDENEREILHHYSEKGRLLTLLQSTFTSSCVVIMLLPIIPKLLDVVNPLTEPRPNMYILQGEFFVNREEHFYELWLTDCITVVMIIIAVTGADTMYVASSQHSCALYSIVSYRMRKLRRMILDSALSIENGDSYDWLVYTIQLHQTALDFTSTLNESYSSAFLLTVPQNLFLVPFASCAILATLDQPLHLIPYLAYFVSTAFHLFILCWPGQTILDHEFELCDDAYYNEWYTTPLRTRKLLLIFMTRCLQPATITAGGLFLLNYETFSLIFRTAVSYITVAASFR